MELERVLKALGEPMRLKIYQNLLEQKHGENMVTTHYVPVQETLDSFLEIFMQMQRQSANLNRDMSVCQCEFKTEEK